AQDSNLVHYDGRAFLLEMRDNDWLINWFSIININRFSNQMQAAEYLRYKFFVDLASYSTFDYNIDDKRFWEDHLWKEYTGESIYENE
ncbi:MAG: hypothetical protein AAF990_07685, partial [Bacteroidota bacterium]